MKSDISQLTSLYESTNPNEQPAPIHTLRTKRELLELMNMSNIRGSMAFPGMVASDNTPHPLIRLIDPYSGENGEFKRPSEFLSGHDTAEALVHPALRKRVAWYKKRNFLPLYILYNNKIYVLIQAQYGSFTYELLAARKNPFKGNVWYDTLDELKEAGLERNENVDVIDRETGSITKQPIYRIHVEVLQGPETLGDHGLDEEGEADWEEDGGPEAWLDKAHIYISEANLDEIVDLKGIDLHRLVSIQNGVELLNVPRYSNLKMIYDLYNDNGRVPNTFVYRSRSFSKANVEGWGRTGEHPLSRGLFGSIYITGGLELFRVDDEQAPGDQMIFISDKKIDLLNVSPGYNHPEVGYTEYVLATTYSPGAINEALVLEAGGLRYGSAESSINLGEVYNIDKLTLRHIVTLIERYGNRPEFIAYNGSNYRIIGNLRSIQPWSLRYIKWTTTDSTGEYVHAGKVSHDDVQSLSEYGHSTAMEGFQVDVIQSHLQDPNMTTRVWYHIDGVHKVASLPIGTKIHDRKAGFVPFYKSTSDILKSYKLFATDPPDEILLGNALGHYNHTLTQIKPVHGYKLNADGERYHPHGPIFSGNPDGSRLGWSVYYTDAPPRESNASGSWTKRTLTIQFDKTGYPFMIKYEGDGQKEMASIPKRSDETIKENVNPVKKLLGITEDTDPSIEGDEDIPTINTISDLADLLEGPSKSRPPIVKYRNEVFGVNTSFRPDKDPDTPQAWVHLKEIVPVEKWNKAGDPTKARDDTMANRNLVRSHNIVQGLKGKYSEPPYSKHNTLILGDTVLYVYLMSFQPISTSHVWTNKLLIHRRDQPSAVVTIDRSIQPDNHESGVDIPYVPFLKKLLDVKGLTNYITLPSNSAEWGRGTFTIEHDGTKPHAPVQAVASPPDYFFIGDPNKFIFHMTYDPVIQTGISSSILPHLHGDIEWLRYRGWERAENIQDIYVYIAIKRNKGKAPDTIEQMFWVQDANTDSTKPFIEGSGEKQGGQYKLFRHIETGDVPIGLHTHVHDKRESWNVIEQWPYSHVKNHNLGILGYTKAPRGLIPEAQKYPPALLTEAQKVSRIHEGRRAGEPEIPGHDDDDPIYDEIRDEEETPEPEDTPQTGLTRGSIPIIKSFNDILQVFNTHPAQRPYKFSYKNTLYERNNKTSDSDSHLTLCYYNTQTRKKEESFSGDNDQYRPHGSGEFYAEFVSANIPDHTRSMGTNILYTKIGGIENFKEIPLAAINLQTNLAYDNVRTPVKYYGTIKGIYSHIDDFKTWGSRTLPPWYVMIRMPRGDFPPDIPGLTSPTADKARVFMLHTYAHGPKHAKWRIGLPNSGHNYPGFPGISAPGRKEFTDKQIKRLTYYDGDLYYLEILFTDNGQLDQITLYTLNRAGAVHDYGIKKPTVNDNTLPGLPREKRYIISVHKP